MRALIERGSESTAKLCGNERCMGGRVEKGEERTFQRKSSGVRAEIVFKSGKKRARKGTGNRMKSISPRGYRQQAAPRGH